MASSIRGYAAASVWGKWPAGAELCGLEDYYQEQGRDWERYAMVKGGLWGIATASMLTSCVRCCAVCFPSLHRFQRDSVAAQHERMIAREVRRRGLTDNIKLGAAAFAKLNLSSRCSSSFAAGETVAAIALFTANAQRHCRAASLSENDAEQLRVAYLFLRRLETCCKALTTNKPRRFLLMSLPCAAGVGDGLC